MTLKERRAYNAGYEAALSEKRAYDAGYRAALREAEYLEEGAKLKALALAALMTFGGLSAATAQKQVARQSPEQAFEYAMEQAPDEVDNATLHELIDLYSHTAEGEHGKYDDVHDSVVYKLKQAGKKVDKWSNTSDLDDFKQANRIKATKITGQAANNIRNMFKK